MTNRKSKEKRKSSPTPVMSIRLDDGRLLETVLIQDGRVTSLCLGSGDRWQLKPSYKHRNKVVVPYAASNSLITNNVVILAGEPMEYGSREKLITNIQKFIHKYVDLSADFEMVAAHYVLLTWIYDRFNELPYLRFRGDYGSGKTRCLQTIGSICYKAIFTSGASSISPIFRMIDSIRGTLLIDEADYRFSDPTTDIIKILNNGNAKGFPILRTECDANGEYNPKAFTVFGPKLIASRNRFSDLALESRCITEELGLRRLRTTIPINMPESMHNEAANLRRKLLLFRLREFDKHIPSSELTEFEPRLRQIFNPLYSLMENAEARSALTRILEWRQLRMDAERSDKIEALLVKVIAELLSRNNHQVGISEIAEEFMRRHAMDFGSRVTPRWIGHQIRNRLFVVTTKSNGRYVIPVSELPKLKWLFEKYGVTSM